MLVAADTYRPAAVTQLETLGKQLNVPVYSEGRQAVPPTIVANALKKAKAESYSAVVLDTAVVWRSMIR